MLICSAVVVMAHAGLAAALANWHDLVQGDETRNALVVDLEPLPVDVADRPTEELHIFNQTQTRVQKQNGKYLMIACS